MTPVSDEQRIQLARASKRAAGISVVGIAVIFGTFGFSAWQLRTLSLRVKEETAKIEGLREQATNLEAEKNTVRTELAGLRAGVNDLEELKEQLEKEVDGLKTKVAEAEAEWRFAEESFQVASRRASDFEQALNAPTNRNFYEKFAKSAPIQTVVRPRASAEPIRDNPSRFNFALWVEVPEWRKDEIESVAYRFNHPTFVNKVQRSNHPDDGYRVGYVGWGTLHRVVITIHLRAGGQREIAFDMAAALNQSAEADVPTKGAPKKRQIQIPFKGRSKVPFRGQSKVPVNGSQVPAKDSPGQKNEDEQ